MFLRVLFGVATTAVLVAGFALRSTTPAESVHAAASVERAPVEHLNRSVSVLTEVVTAQTIRSVSPGASNGALTQVTSVRGGTARARKRSLFARVLLGNGASRPEPFPRPAQRVSARP
jgi:hypothetical protein